MKSIFTIIMSICVSTSVWAYPYLNDSSAPDGNIGNYYSYQLDAYSSSTGSVSFTTWDSLPNGMNLTSSGLLYGTPMQSGYYYISLELHDGEGWNYQGISFYIDDDIVDVDDDGMSDFWEQTVADAISNDVISSIYEVLRDDDFDGDTYSNIEEYLLGFDPVIVDGNEPDSVIEGLVLIGAALSNTYDSVYVDLINDCFTKALVQEPYNVRIRVYRALANVLLLAQRDDIHELVEDFGYYLTDDRVHSETDVYTENSYDFDYETAPSVDLAKGVILSNLVALIDQSLDDLNYVPNGWTSYVEFSSVYFRSDDTYYVDEADVVALKGILHLFRSYLQGLHAYQINHLPYDQWAMPLVVSNASITIDGDINDWLDITYSLIGSQSTEISNVKCVRSLSNLFLLVNFKENVLVTNNGLTFLLIDYAISPNQYEQIILDAGGQETIENQFGIYWDIQEMNEVEVPDIQSAINKNYFEAEISLPSNLFTTAFMLSGIRFGIQENGGTHYGTYELDDSLTDIPLDNNPLADINLLAEVKTNLMLDAGASLRLGIDLLQDADSKIHARTDLLMHLFEYEIDEEFSEDRQDLLDQVQEFENYLVSTNDYIYELKNKFADVDHHHDHEEEEEEEHYNLIETHTNALYLGALFEPKFIDRNLIPEFEGHLKHPKIRELPDPTIGGLFPHMTQQELSELISTQNRDLASIELIGTNIVSESSTSQYQVVAHYLNGLSEDVTSNSTFIVNKEDYLIDNTNGVLTTPQLSSDESIILIVDYLGEQENDTFMVDLSVLIEDMELREALDNNQIVWTTGGTSTNSGWSGQNFDSYDGVDAAKSGLTGDQSTSWLEGIVTGSGTLSFWYKISSEQDADELKFWIDDQIMLLDSGEKEWKNLSYEVAAEGNHQFRWAYEKDKSDVIGQDSVWLDQVTWSGAAVISSFQSWASDRGLTGDMSTLFTQDHDGNGIPNGLEYAFGSNMSMNIKIIHDEPGVEMSVQNSFTEDFVDIEISGTTNLVDWSLEVSELGGAPEGYKWYAPTNIPDSAFFKVDATLK